MPSVQLTPPIDPKRWGVYAHTAPKKGIVSIDVDLGAGGLKPSTTSRGSNWLGRFSLTYMQRQFDQYLKLAAAIDQASQADPDIAHDPDVKAAQDALIEKIRGKAVQAKSLRWGDVGALLIRWDAAMKAAEFRKAGKIDARQKQALEQLDKSGPFQGDAQDLAKALLLPDKLPPRHASSNSKPSKLKAGAFETVFNSYLGESQDYAAVADTPELREEIQKSQVIRQREKEEQTAAAHKGLLAADPHAPLEMFEHFARNVTALNQLEADCHAYFAAKKPTRAQTEAMRTVASLGSIEPREAAAKFGANYVISGEKHLPPNIRRGLAALRALTMVNHYVTRGAMELRALEEIASQKESQNAAAREAQLKEFKGRCDELQKQLKKCVAQLSLLSHTLARVSDFDGMPPSQKLILRRFGDHFEAMSLYLSGQSLSQSGAPNEHGTAYQFASLGKAEPEAALKLLRGALVHAEHGAPSPVRSHSSKQLLSRASRATFSIEDTQVEAENAKHSADLVDELESLYPSTTSSANDDQDKARDAWSKLLDELEELGDAKDGKNRVRPTSQAMDEHLRAIKDAYHSEVSLRVDAPDPGALLDQRPGASTQDERRPAPAVLRSEAQQRIRNFSERFRAQADYLTKSPNELRQESIDPTTALRFHSALGKAPLPAEWVIDAPPLTRSKLPPDMQRGAAATYALTQGPALLAKLDEQALALVTQMNEEAQGSGPDGSTADRLASAAAAYRQAYETAVEWLESRSQHLLSAPFLQAFSDEDQHSLKQYGEGLATMARVLRHPESPEAQLLASAQPKEAVEPAQRSVLLQRELTDHTGRRLVKKRRSRKNSEPNNKNLRNKITRETSSELRPHLRALRRQTWANAAASSQLGIAHDGSSSDASMEQLISELENTKLMSPRSLSKSQRDQEQLSANAAQAERTVKRTGNGHSRPVSGDQISEIDSAPSTYKDVDDYLAGLEASFLSLYDGKTAPLQNPSIPEPPARKRSVSSPRTARKELTQLINTVEAEKRAADKAKLKKVKPEAAARASRTAALPPGV